MSTPIAKAPVVTIRPPVPVSYTKPSRLYYVFLWKDQLDPSAPLWKKLFFRWLYRPFNQFCRFRLGLPTFNTEDSGYLLWTEHQGIVSEEWQAVQAAQTPNWGYHELPLDNLLPASTCVERCVNHNYPLSDARARYRKKAKPTVEVPALDLAKLKSQVARTDELIRNSKSSVI